MLEASDEPHKPTATQWATAIFQLLLDGLQVFLSTADLGCHTGTSEGLSMPTSIDHLVDPKSWSVIAFCSSSQHFTS
jgi:hypothetical protein